MPEMSTKYVPKHMHDENPDPRLLKFVRKVTDRLPAKLHGVKTEDPEYWGFACIFEDELTKEERDIALDLLLRMKLRKKYSLKEMKKRAAVTPETEAKFDEVVDKLAVLGMLEYDYGDKYTKDGPIEGTSFTRARPQALSCPHVRRNSASRRRDVEKECGGQDRRRSSAEAGPRYPCRACRQA